MANTLKQGVERLKEKAGTVPPAAAEVESTPAATSRKKEGGKTDLNNKKGAAGGVCIITDLEGDKAYLTWQGSQGLGLGARGPGTFEWTGGTGKYKEIKGSNTYVGVTQVSWSDGTASGYATWNR